MKHQVLDILTNIKAHILVNFPGMTPSFGMIAYYQFNHIQSLLTRDREIEGLREWAEMWEGSLTRAVKVAEALQNALTIAQQTSKQKLQEAAEEKSRLLYRIRQKDETIATMSAETQRLTQEVKNSTEEGGQSSKNGTDTATTDKNIIAELKAQLKKANHERRAAEASGLRQSTIATELREQLKAAREKTLEAESKQADTAKRAEAAEERVSQLESRIESLANTLATNNTAFVEAAFRANEAEDNATKTRKALKEHIAELVGQHVENQRVKDAEEAARRAKGEANHLVKSQVGQLNKLKATCDAYRERYGKLDDVKPSTATMSNVNALPSAPSISLNGSSQTPVKESTEGTSQSASVEVSQVCPRPLFT